MNSQTLRNTILAFQCLLLSASCSPEEPEYPLQGHWVQVEGLLEDGYLDIIDITDSTTLHYWDKFDPPKEVTLVYQDTIYLPRYHLRYSPFWKLDKDLLTIYDEGDRVDSIVYSRIRDNRLWQEEYFNPLRVSIELEDWSADYDLSRAEATEGRANADIFIGPAKDLELPTDTYIVVNGVFIGLDGVEQWIGTERDMMDYEKRKRLKILFHVDKGVGLSKMEEVMKALESQKEPYNVYLAGLSEEIQDLVYRKID